jgi:hypothetical protein
MELRGRRYALAALSPVKDPGHRLDKKLGGPKSERALRIELWFAVRPPRDLWIPSGEVTKPVRWSVSPQINVRPAANRAGIAQSA